MPIIRPSEIELHDRDEVESLIGNPPNWLQYWGMTVVFLVLAGGVALAWLVEYPDVVEAKIVLTTENPPIRLVARASAPIKTLSVKNGQAVEPGALLAQLENPAEMTAVSELEQWLRAAQSADPGGLMSVSLPKSGVLGDLQADVAQLSASLEALKAQLGKDINLLKINNIQSRIKQVEVLNGSLGRQAVILEQELAIAKSGMERDSILWSKNSLSKLEYDHTLAYFLAKKRELELLASQQQQHAIRQKEMESEILDLQSETAEAVHQKVLDFQAKADALLGKLSVWKQTWQLVSPIAGNVALNKIWSPNQFVQEGEEVMTIVPSKSAGRVIAKGSVAGFGAGKVNLKAVVYIRLEGFPYQEFGEIEGVLEEILAVPNQGGYQVTISLSQDLRTSHGISIPFQQETPGTARIVTERRSLLARIFEQLKRAFHSK